MINVIMQLIILAGISAGCGILIGAWFCTPLGNPLQNMGQMTILFIVLAVVGHYSPLSHSMNLLAIALTLGVAAYFIYRNGPSLLGLRKP